jgi:hypothetical protein
MLFKTISKLFKGTYQYKVVLICAGAGLFRNKNLPNVLSELSKIQLNSQTKQVRSTYYSSWQARGISTQEDLDYAFKLQHTIAKMHDIDVRVESPWLSIYTNTKSNIDQLVKLDDTKVKYVCVPPIDTALDKETIIMPKMNFDFRVTLGKTTTNYISFIDWAETNKKLKLTKSCKNDLSKDRSYGGTHFYVSGDNNLLLAKMHLGGCISKIQRIIKVKA